MQIVKLPYIRRPPSLTEFNSLIEKVNEIIDKLNTKIEIEEVAISREVKDFAFFKGEETKLPYHAEYTITSNEDAAKIFELYNFSYKEIKQINDTIIRGNYISLTIDVVEEVTEKDKKQEAVFETVEAISLDEIPQPKKKRWRKKKTSWN